MSVFSHSRISIFLRYFDAKKNSIDFIRAKMVPVFYEANFVLPEVRTAVDFGVDARKTYSKSFSESLLCITKSFHK